MALTTPPILDVAEMRAAEARAIASGTAARTLMERAGAAAAEAILRFDAPRAATILCGPGGNGGDGYVVARHLRAAGVAVTVAADGAPRSEPAAAAAHDWDGPIVPLAEALAGGALVDAVFGIGMSRPLDAALAHTLGYLAEVAQLRVALDVPSGVGTDDGAGLGCPFVADLTIAFGAYKPAHFLHPAAARCGRIVVADIGLSDIESALVLNTAPRLPGFGPEAHKYARGAVFVVGGPSGHGGAARLAAHAALRAGAGLVTIGVPAAALVENAARLDAVMLRVVDDAAGLAVLLDDRRAAAFLLGPGLGHDDRARGLLEAALASGRPLVLDADVFTLFAGDAAGLARRISGPVVLTPHEGEFARTFSTLPGSKVDRAPRRRRAGRGRVRAQGSRHRHRSARRTRPHQRPRLGRARHRRIGRRAGRDRRRAARAGARRVRGRLCRRVAARRPRAARRCRADRRRPAGADPGRTARPVSEAPTIDADLIVRIGGRGDGVTGDGRFVPFGVPGDRLGADGMLVPGPDHLVPPCRHYPECGGCQLQHVSDPAYERWAVDRIVSALAGIPIGRMEPVHLSPPRSRRRASLRAVKRGGQLTIGFNAEASHRIVDLHECHVLRPELFALVAPLRRLLGGVLGDGRAAGVTLTLTDAGIDVLLAGIEATTLKQIERLTAFADAQALARLAVDNEDGLTVISERAQPTLRFAGVPVALPPAAFLQATADGEAALVAAVLAATSGAPRIADLFSGLGTFALPLAVRGARVLAADAAGTAVTAPAPGGTRRRAQVDHRAPRPVPQPDGRPRARPLRRRGYRSAPRRSRCTDCRAGRVEGAAGGRGVVQP